MTWAATQAKAKFSEVLDRAETEGPQLVKRRNREFVVITKDDLAKRTTVEAAEKPFVSAWDAMKPSFDERYDFDIPRTKSKARWVKF